MQRTALSVRFPQGLAGWLSSAVFLTALIPLSVHGQTTTPTPLADLDLTPLLPVWSPLYALSVGTGFRDNLLLSKENREQSGFISTGLDFTLWRRPIEDGKEFQLVFSGADRRYWAKRSMDHETWGYLHAKFLRNLNDRWIWVTALEGSTFDQVVDVSFLESTPARERLQGGTLGLNTGVRWNLGAKEWLQVSPLGSRTWLRGAFDSFNDFGSTTTFGHAYGLKSEWHLDYTWRERLFDRREKTTASGVSVPGSSLRYEQHELFWVDTHHWDAAKRWKTSTRMGAVIANDNGGGYYDYWKLSAGESIMFRSKHWNVSLDAVVSHYQFPHQDSSSAPTRRRMRDDLTATLRTERRLSTGWKLFVDYSYETVVASDVLESYTANTVSTGVVWEF